MQELRRKIRNLMWEYEESLLKLKEEHNKDLKLLQGQCPHEHTTPFSYKIDTAGEVACDPQGNLYLYKECFDCGHIERIIGNDYDSEIPFYE